MEGDAGAHLDGPHRVVVVGLDALGQVRVDDAFGIARGDGLEEGLGPDLAGRVALHDGGHPAVGVGFDADAQRAARHGRVLGRCRRVVAPPAVVSLPPPVVVAPPAVVVAPAVVVLVLSSSSSPPQAAASIASVMAPAAIIRPGRRFARRSDCCTWFPLFGSMRLPSGTPIPPTPACDPRHERAVAGVTLPGLDTMSTTTPRCSSVAIRRRVTRRRRTLQPTTRPSSPRIGRSAWSSRIHTSSGVPRASTRTRMPASPRASSSGRASTS